ncbi:GDSL-type esterase/lipase family protein [Anaerococcus sp. AGMB09787]|uniref:GDSL-type esterase/lipase family protein n=1 Tax=Anaerococcus sp. AGMB09787 TaxID=2922869 RepID=UPI001FAED883|nr:GDSL-type esterase/lipase family protein [Anaerococcus sp. AGMB09787]
MKITCLGDSLTEGYLVGENNYARLIEKAGFDVSNLGINGAWTDTMVKIYRSFIEGGGDEEVLIVFGGTNDFLHGKSPRFVYDNVKSILDMSKACRKILVIPPQVEEEEGYDFYKMVNDKIEDYSLLLRKEDIETIDARTIPGRNIDGVHWDVTFHRGLKDEILRRIKDGKS